MFAIRAAATPQEREEVCRFRYQVYVEEMGKKLRHANHGERILREPFDDDSVLLYALEGGEVLGTLRWTPCAPHFLGPHLCRALELTRFTRLFRPERISFTSRFMVTARCRKSLVAGKLVQSVYRLARERDVQFDFIHASPALVSFYEHVGHRRYAGSFIDPDAGAQVPMVLVLEDVEHLHRVRSPFLRLARAWRNDPQPGRWFQETYGQDPSGAPSISTPAPAFQPTCAIC
jgi:N-acyl-L-homoserine lactone synthetase